MPSGRDSSSDAARSSGRNVGGLLKDILSRYGTVLAIALLFAIFTPWTDGRFIQPANILSILNQGSVLTIMALGLTVVLILGDFDLSFSYLATFGGIFAVGLMAQSGLPVLLAIAIALAVCTAAGWFNGLMITKWGLHSVVATLGMSSLAMGMIYLYSGGNQISAGIPDSFLIIGREKVAGIPVPVLIALAAIIVMWMYLEHTVPGRKMHAVGGNVEAAYLSGVNVKRIRRTGFMLAGLMGGAGGIVLASILDIGHPQAANGMMVDGFTAVFLGAVTIKRGQFNVFGTAIGVILLSVIVNGVTMVGADIWVQYAVKGIVLITAVAASGFSAKFKK
jgi:ribose transport system permease protein